MRALASLALIACATLFLAGPVKAESSSASYGHIFASSTCRGTIACPGNAEDSSTYTQAGTECLQHSFNYAAENGFFDSFRSLDINNCLVGKADALPKGMGHKTIPVCCVTKQSDDSCTMRCDVVAPDVK